MKKIQKIACLLLSVAFSLQVMAQEARTVKGTIYDENNEPAIGAVVKVTGETMGALTGADGTFTLSVGAGQNSIEVSSLGYATQTVDVSTQSEVSVTLAPSTNDLDEVVVVGYGAQKKSHLTGSVATVAPTEIADLVGTDMSSALEGQMAGVSVTSEDNRPGASSRITIRNTRDVPGAPSGGDLNPLYVIDGFISSADQFNNLDPNVIESFSVLKDASAAVYGARAAQGVILVTTKRGHVGKPKISYSGSFGWTDEYYRSKMMDSYNYGLIWNAVRDADPNSAYDSRRQLFQYDELEAMKDLNYDLLEKYWHSALTQKHSITVSGGSENATYFGGVAYNTQGGNIGRIDYNRWDYRAGMDAKINQWIKASLQVSGTYGFTQKAKNSIGGSGGEKDYAIMLTHPRYIPEYVTDPATGLTYPIAMLGASNSVQSGEVANFHYETIENNGDFTTNMPQSMVMNSSVNFDMGWINFLKGLKLTASYSKSISTSKNNTYGSQFMLYKFEDDTRGGSGAHLYTDTEGYPLSFSKLSNHSVSNGNELSRSMSRGDNYQLNFVANYARTFGLHDVSGLFTIEKSESEEEDVLGGVGQPYDFTNYQSMSADGAQRTEFKRSESGNLSYVGRLNYAYADKYLAEFLIRVDASTKFAPENYWGAFPSLSLGWIMSKEEWFNNNITFVDFFKLRGSFGMVGRDNIASWGWLQVYGYENFKGPIFGDNQDKLAGQHFQIPDVVPNRNSHWDKVYKSNIGVDMSFLNDRLSAGFEYFYNWQREVFMTITGQAEFPATVGAQASPSNFGSIDDWGGEFSVGWKDKIGKDFRYWVKANTGWSDNKLIKYPFRLPADRDFEAAVPNERSDRGEWGYECIGMFRSYQEIAEFFAENNLTTYVGNTMENVHPGMLIYRDIRGSRKEDGTYHDLNDPNDPTYDKNGQKNMVDGNDYVRINDRKNSIYGFTMNFGAEYKQLSISAQLAASWGKYNFMPGISMNNSNIGNASGMEAMESINLAPFWAGNMFVYKDVFDAQGRIVAAQNVDAKYPNLRFGLNSNRSTFWRVNAANIFLRNITLAYTLPKAWAQKVKMESLRVNVTAQNLFEFYNPYPGKYTSPNSSYEKYPTLRRITMGLNLSF